jgi:hypothetical protein
MASLVSWGVVEMISSFCIETPVPVSGSAQGQPESRCLLAKVAYCHGKTPVPGGAFLTALNS